MPPTSIKKGYSFVLWNPDMINFGTIGNLTTLLDYEPITYNIVYNLDDGENDPKNPNTYTVENDDIILKPATKSGYKFNKWIDENGNLVITIPKSSTGNKILNASYAEQNYFYFEAEEADATVSMEKEELNLQMYHLSIQQMVLPGKISLLELQL